MKRAIARLNENIRTQQEAVREARAHHQTVEERKNPAYLNIGRHLASQGIAPPSAAHLLTEVQRHRAAVDRHLGHTAELALLSSKIDKQELRKFYFSVVSVLVLLAIILPLVFQSPRQREWLPQETDAILSINTDEFERADLPKRWRKDHPDDWPGIWSGLIGPAGQTPGLNLPHDAVRITRALTTDDAGKTREFILVEARGDVSHAIATIDGDKGFRKTRHQRFAGLGTARSRRRPGRSNHAGGWGVERSERTGPSPARNGSGSENHRPTLRSFSGARSRERRSTDFA